MAGLAFYSAAEKLYATVDIGADLIARLALPGFHLYTDRVAAVVVKARRVPGMLGELAGAGCCTLRVANQT